MCCFNIVWSLKDGCYLNSIKALQNPGEHAIVTKIFVTIVNGGGVGLLMLRRFFFSSLIRDSSSGNRIEICFLTCF